MIRFITTCAFLLMAFFSKATTLPVSNKAAFNMAVKIAKPGDTIVLQNGEWENFTLVINCIGTKEKPIIIKAQTNGKVWITGQSSLQLGGEYIVVDGLYFTKGYAGNDAVINFRINKNELANNCRVTNTVINGFNNSKRMDENYWVQFYGKNNRLDHCSFLNKLNMGVLLAIILDDERSRENFHSIDHNYFGVRKPLASNSGEIIRVGVSQHCEFNSNTQITDNLFENCDGETEIVSIKSGSNVIRNNIFKECQGAVVLRHGNFNTVENNIFLGNKKVGTGGVRIINKGQWVINNLFYQCVGTGFRSPLSIMNGVPNSPANRYLPVTDAVVANNSFVDCTPISFCEGSDTERSEPPKQVYFLNNLLYQTKDRIYFHSYDDLSGIHFAGNSISPSYQQPAIQGFSKTNIHLQKSGDFLLPAVSSTHAIEDSLLQIKRSGLTGKLSSNPGFHNPTNLTLWVSNARQYRGTEWFKKMSAQKKEHKQSVYAADAAAVLQLLAKQKAGTLIINLTGKNYSFTEPLSIESKVIFQTSQRESIAFSSNQNLPFLIEVKAGAHFEMADLLLDLKKIKANYFITTDTSGNSEHSQLYLHDCSFSNLNGSFLNAAKSSVSDEINVSKCSFINNSGCQFNFMNETDKKGYYNVEQLKIKDCIFKNNTGQLLSMLRGGNDESTMGPLVIFSGNNLSDCNTSNSDALIYLYGTQSSVIRKNNFSNCNPLKTLLQYEDAVRATHFLENNSIRISGKIKENKFVEQSGNIY